MIGFGEYYYWAYVEVLKQKPNYVAYICTERGGACAGQQKFKEWVEMARR